jgi:hypothetical protein
MFHNGRRVESGYLENTEPTNTSMMIHIVLPRNPAAFGRSPVVTDLVASGSTAVKRSGDVHEDLRRRIRCIGVSSRSLRHLAIRAALCVVVSAGVLNAQITVNTTSAVSNGEAVDASGAVYYVPSPSNNIILKATPSASGYKETTVLTSGNSFTGNIGVDSSGDLYLIASGNVIKETPAPGGTYTETSIPAALTTGLAVDDGGNIYGTTADGIVKLTNSGGTYTAAQVVSGLSSPSGVSVDNSGNLYIVEAGNSRVLKETWVSGSFAQSVIVSGLTHPRGGVAVDGQGNVYITDLNHVYKALPSAGSYTVRLFGYFDFETPGEVEPYWLALDADGTTLYVEGPSPGFGRVLAFATSSVDPTGLQFGSVELGGNATLTLSYTFTTAATLGTLRVTTQGATGQDFVDAGGGSCVAGASYAADASCTVAVMFSPRYAGGRSGAVTLVDSSGAVIVDAPLSGFGTGPQMAFFPATVSTVIPSVTAYTSIAVDGNGIIYLADDVNKRVLKELPSGSGSYTESIVASGLIGPKGIAVDGAGNLYAVDNDTKAIGYGHGIALKFTPRSSGGYAQTTIATGLSFSGSITVDSSGNVYVNDNGPAGPTVVRLALLPGARYTQTRIVISAPFGGIGVDGSGNIYVGDQANSHPVKLIPGPLGDYTTSVVPPYDLTTNGSIAVDGSGDVYISGTGAGSEPQVYRVKLNPDGTSTLSASAGSGVIAVDGGGSIYGIGSANSDGIITTGVYKADQATPPTLSFLSTPVGTTNPENKDARFTNIGNAPLSFTIPSSGTNPSISANFLASLTERPDWCPQLTSGSSGATLDPGTECAVFVEFAPIVSGPIAGTVTITDDNLNVVGATQIVHLNGTGIASGQPPATLTWAMPAPIVYGTPLSGTQLDATANVAGSFVYNPAAGTVLSPGTHTLMVTFTPTDTTAYSSATATVQLSVTVSSPTLSWATPAPIVYGTPLSGTQLNATANVAGSFVYNPVAGTVLTPGTHTLMVTFTPTDTIAYSSATATVQLSVTASSPTLGWATPAPIVYGTPLSGTQLNATANVPGSFVYSPVAGTVLKAGIQTLGVTFTPNDTTAYSPGTAMVQLVVNQAVPALLWSTPASIPYGTALSATQLNATASVPGTFLYSPAAGTVPQVGEQALSATFAPTDAVDYTSASAIVTLTVTPSSLDFTFTNTGATYQTVIPGAASSFTFKLAPLGGTYPGDVTFSVAGLPPGANYTITPATVGQAAGPQAETLRIQTAGLVAGADPNDNPSGGPALPPLFLSIALVPLSLIRLRRQRKVPGARFLVLLLITVATLVVCVGLSGCGSGNGFFGVAPKNYTITVTASSSSIQHAASVTLNLQ